MNKAERDESRKICDAASGGTWQIEHDTGDEDDKRLWATVWIIPDQEDALELEMLDADANFLLHAREALPKALDRIEELVEAFEELLRAREIGIDDSVAIAKRALEGESNDS